MKAHGSDGESVLRKDRRSPTYEWLLKRAVEDGRVGGKHACPICGMRYKSFEEADGCCEKVLSHGGLPLDTRPTREPKRNGGIPAQEGNGVAHPPEPIAQEEKEDPLEQDTEVDEEPLPQIERWHIHPEKVRASFVADDPMLDFHDQVGRPEERFLETIDRFLKKANGDLDDVLWRMQEAGAELKKWTWVCWHKKLQKEGILVRQEE